MIAELKTVGDVTIVSLQGRLEIEETQPFRDLCLKHLIHKNVVFNLSQTDFVGSTGIQAFLDTLSGLCCSDSGHVRIVTMRSEFKRIFGSLELHKLKIFDNESMALGSFEII